MNLLLSTKNGSIPLCDVAMRCKQLDRSLGNKSDNVVCVMGTDRSGKSLITKILTDMHAFVAKVDPDRYIFAKEIAGIDEYIGSPTTCRVKNINATILDFPRYDDLTKFVWFYAMNRSLNALFIKLLFVVSIHDLMPKEQKPSLLKTFSWLCKTFEDVSYIAKGVVIIVSKVCALEIPIVRMLLIRKINELKIAEKKKLTIIVNKAKIVLFRSPSGYKLAPARAVLSPLLFHKIIRSVSDTHCIEAKPICVVSPLRMESRLNLIKDLRNSIATAKRVFSSFLKDNFLNAGVALKKISTLGILYTAFIDGEILSCIKNIAKVLLVKKDYKKTSIDQANVTFSNIICKYSSERFNGVKKTLQWIFADQVLAAKMFNHLQLFRELYYHLYSLLPYLCGSREFLNGKEFSEIVSL